MSNGKVDAKKTAPDGSQTLSIGKLFDPKVIIPVLTAVLVYIGAARTDAMYERFGLDRSMLNLSTTDYVMRSLRLVFMGLGIALLVGVSAPEFHRRAIAKMGRVKRPRMFLLTLWTTSAVLLFAGSSMHTWPQYWSWVGLPLDTLGYLLVFLGSGLILYNLFLTEFGATDGAILGFVLSRPFMYLYTVGLCFFLLLLIFSSFRSAGRIEANSFVEHLADKHSVIVYSKNPLGLDYDGVQETKVSSVKDAYQYRYTGLKFLVRADKRYFLLPERWAEDKPVTFVIPEDETIRVEMVPVLHPAEPLPPYPLP